MMIQEQMSLEEKLHILSDAAKYDVACTSSAMREAGTAKESETASRRAFATAFRRTAGAFPF